MIGKTVSHYKILEGLGTGGMGVVYKAEDTKLRRTVALKFLPPELTRDPEAKKRFIHEAQAASSLQHINICSIHEIDETDDGHLFICMDCYEGEALDRKIARGPLPIDEALDYAIQVAEGLSEAHEAGMVHRDIKPANLLVTEKGVVKIVDFGLAKLASRTKLTRTGTTVGTASYMSPEQARGEDVDHRTDIWSLGVVLYEMLAGQLPFRADHEPALLYSISSEEPEPLSNVRREVPAGLEDIVRKAMQKAPSERYPDLGSMLGDLKRARAGGEVKVQLPTAGRGRKPIAIALGLVAVAAVAILLWPAIKQRLHVGKVEAKTLAVVDFDNIGGEEASHLAGGLAEGISVKLAKLSGVHVVSGDDVRRLRKNDLPAKEVALRLGAEFAIGGSLLKSGERIRVTPELVEASTGNVVWSEGFDREFIDVFEFLDEVSLRIANALELELTPGEEAALHDRATDNPQAYDHYLKGRESYYRITYEDNEKAEKELQRALRLDGDYPLALAGLADTYVQRYKERYDYDEYWLDEADRLIERALELESDLAEAYESRAELLLEKESYVEALGAAEKARSLRPDWDEPYLRLGEIYHRRGEESLALEMFDKALTIRVSVDALCGRGEVLEWGGLVDSALVAFRRAAAHNPNHERPFYKLGFVYYYSFNDLDEAERMLRRAIEVRPDRGRSYKELSNLLFYGRGRLQEAEDLLRGFSQKYPYHHEAYSNLFNFLAGDKADYPEALTVAEDATIRHPDKAWAHLLLAKAYAMFGEAGESEKAVEAVKKALELRPESHQVFYEVALTCLGLNDPERALHYCRRALEVNPGSPKVLRYMAEYLLGQARFDSAAVVAEEYVKQVPGTLAGFWYLEFALVHLMRADEYTDIIENHARIYGESKPYLYVWLAKDRCLTGRYHEAMELYDRILGMRETGDSIDLDLIEDALTGLGIAQWLSGDAEAALTSFEEAASTGGSEGLHLYDMMVIPLLKYLGRCDEIETILDNLHEDGLIDSWVWHARYYYPSMRLFDRALSIIAEGLESDEVTYKEDLALRTATWHRQSGDLASAESVLRRIEADLPRFYRGDHDLEWSFIKALRGDLPGALRFARSAFDQAIDYSDLNRYVTALAKLCYASGRIQDALDVLERANSFQDNTAAFYMRSQMAAVTNSPNAEFELRRVLLLATRGSRSGDWRMGQGTHRIYAALASARLGDPVQARAEIEYAVRLEPERADIAYYAACAYALAGDTDKALDWLQTAVDRGHQELWWARVDPDLDNLREEPRFKEIMDDWERRMRALLE